MKNLNNLVTRTAECHRVFAGQRDLDYVAVNYSEAMLIKAEVDDRIAELTADLKVADRAALELAAEVARYKDAADTYREALNDIAGWGQTSFGVGPLVEQMRNRARSAISVARNALKEGSDG